MDLRLLAPAAAAWAAAMLTPRLPVAAALAGAGVAAGLGLLALTLSRTGLPASTRRPGAAGSGAGWPLVLAAALLGGAGAAAATASRVAALAEGPVSTLAEQRATVHGEGVVTGDPRPRPDRVQGRELRTGSVVVPVRLEQVEARGERVGVRSPIVVLTQESPAAEGGGGPGESRHGPRAGHLAGAPASPEAQGRWRDLLPGQRVQISGRLAPAQRGEAVALLTMRGPPRLLGEPGVVQRAAGRLRAGLREAVAALPEDERGLVPGLVVGDTSQLPAQLEEDFRTAGLTHLTAVSGANCAIVVGFVLVLTRALGMRRRPSLFVAALALLGFVVLARPQPSVLRAAVMGGLAIAALATGRRRAGLSALCAAVLLLVLVDPGLGRSYGFALSVLATGGILLLAPRWERGLSARLPALARPAAGALAIPLAAQVACAPVVVLLSATVSLVAVPANLAAAPLVAPATVLGVLAAVTAPVSEPLAGVFGRLAGLPAAGLVAVAEHAAAVPHASIGWPAGLGGALLLAVICLLAALALRRLPLRGVAAAAVIVLVAVTVPRMVWPGWPPKNWLLVACDVGQGDALVLAAGPGSAVVVDAGPDPRSVDRCLRDLGVRQVPLVVLTHLHADHAEGLPGVLRGRAVGALALGPLDEPRTEAARVQRWAAQAQVPVERVVPGEQRQSGGLRWQVLGPTRVVHGEGSAANNASVVLLAESEGVRMLLTGDVEPPGQRALLSALPGGVDVLKVAHHGSAHQEPALLARAAPRVALVSAGEGNDYGHPAPSTLDRLAAAGAQVLRTDEHGDVAVVNSDGGLGAVARGR